MKTLFKIFLSIVAACTLVACGSDSDDPVVDQSDIIQISQSNLDVQLACDDTWKSIAFTSRANWTASVTSGSEWCSLKETSGMGGSCSLGIQTKKNTAKEARTAQISLKAGGQTVEITVTQALNPVEEMSEDQVPSYKKFFNNSDTRGMNMFKSDAKWSWYRYKESEHFFVFWEPGFGDDPNKVADPALRVDVDDLLKKAEQFYNTNITQIKMATLGKSQLDNYKMQIYLLYTPEWLATGSGYDNTIGALWVNPSTCQPVGSTIAHEIGHSFQYQVYCDQIYNGAPDDMTTGFRYGYPGSNGGNGYWEQCAQWQSYQDYPAEAIDNYHFGVWKNNYHRHFEHEWMRYASYWLQYYWVEKHGIEAYGRIWKESKYPDDAIMTYTRLYNDGDWSKTADEIYEYAAKMATYDLDAVRPYLRENDHINKYNTTLIEVEDGYYQVAYNSCVQSTGFNVIRLNVPENGGAVAADFVGLPSNSLLATGDQGQYFEEENPKGTTNKYNGTVTNDRLGWHWGFVAYKNDGTRVYGDAQKGTEGRVTFDCPADTKYLYLVVAGTPTTYKQNPWDEKELTDEQLPYKVKFAGTNVFGHIDINTGVDPSDITIPMTVNCDAALGDYVQGAVSLADSDALTKICQAFVMQSSQLASSTLAIANGQTATPTEGMVALGLLQPDGKIAYNYTANAGFYCTAEGAVGSWGNGDPLWFEYAANEFTLTYGHFPGKSEAGKAYVIKPVFVYTKNGKQYKAVIELTMQF